MGEMPEREWFETKLVEKKPVLVERMQFFEQESAAGVDYANRILPWMDGERLRSSRLSGSGGTTFPQEIKDISFFLFGGVAVPW